MNFEGSSDEKKARALWAILGIDYDVISKAQFVNLNRQENTPYPAKFAEYSVFFIAQSCLTDAIILWLGQEMKVVFPSRYGGHLLHRTKHRGQDSPVFRRSLWPVPVQPRQYSIRQGIGRLVLLVLAVLPPNAGHGLMKVLPGAPPDSKRRLDFGIDGKWP